MSRLLAVALTLALASMLPAAPSFGRDPDTAQVVAGLQAWLDGTKDLSGRFEQRIVSGAFGAGTTERGKLVLLRPGRMRWDYESPEKKVALVNGEATLVYLPAERQLVRGRLSGEGGAFASLLAGDARVSDLFSALLVSGPREGAPETYRLRLAPRSAEQGLEAVLLTLSAPDFGIAGAEVVDPAGNVIEYTFRSMRRNRGVSPEVFHFEPPSGTEIVEAAGK
jgi:outer membrane lipoprotein carrier protein